MGRITNAGAPAWAWSSGAFDQTVAITRAGAGDITLSLRPGYGQVATEAVMFVQPSIAYSASNLRATGVVDTTAIQKQITSLQEGVAGAASALTDMDLDVLLIGLGHRAREARVGMLHGMAFLAGGGAANIRDQNGAFDAAVIDNGVGDWTMTYANGFDLGANEGVHILGGADFNAAASSLRSFGLVRPDAQTVRITAGAEQAAGAASIPLDTNVSVLSFRLL
jgi:hypothetical protein